MQSRLERTKIYLNVDEACEYLGISRSLMDKLTTQKRITYVLMGGRKFKRQWLDDYADRNRIDWIE